MNTTLACSHFLELCEYALMAEVSATPKPGLVDLHDSGAHKDMCFDTFRASSAAIAPHIASALSGPTKAAPGFLPPSAP